MSEKKKKGSRKTAASGPGDNIIQFEPRPSGLPDDPGDKPRFSFSGEVELDSLFKADEIIFDAMNADTEEETLRLARKALSVSEDCVDAWVLLGHFAENLDDAVEFYNKGVEAAERVLGEDPFVNSIGYFWGLVETRPYMRALHGLAVCLDSSGYLEDAANFYRGMLVLNPNDNQGVRYPLAQLLLELDLNEEAEELFNAYDENIEPSWNYSRALLDFRKHGPSRIADKSLEAAFNVNGVIPEYLLGRKELPEELPEDFADGQDEEAALYAAASKHVWESDKKALSWLKSRTEKGR